MNTYTIIDINGKTLDTITANTIDEAKDYANYVYGTGTNIIRQYSTSTTTFDPLWILGALLLIAIVTRKRR